MYLKYFLFIILFSIISCQKNENPVEPNYEQSSFTAKVGDEKWEGKSYLDFASNEVQQLFFVIQNSYKYMRVEIIFNGKGEYEIKDSNAVLIETIGGDVVIGEYYSITNQNKITISSYEKSGNKIEGTFNLSFKNQETIIEVTEGKFVAYIINKN